MQVSVFCPSKKSNHCYLCITPNNIVTIYADVSAASEILVSKQLGSLNPVTMWLLRYTHNPTSCLILRGGQTGKHAGR